MPAIATKGEKKGASAVHGGIPSAHWAIPYVGSLLFGAILGLCAPGINQWYLAWVGVVPLLILSISSGSWWQAFLRGTAFGFAYNLVYQNWCLGLQPLDWLGFNWWQGWLLAIAAWLFVSIHQGLIIGIFSAICRLLPLSGTLLPHKMQGQWRLPALILIPIAWILITNKLGNAHNALGVPWSMLEYSQYKQPQVTQVCSIIGGIGLGCLIVFINTAFAILVATYTRNRQLKPLAAPNKTIALYQIVSAALLLAVAILFGYQESSSLRFHPTEHVSIVQSNFNIEMQKTNKRYSLADILRQYSRMFMQCSSNHSPSLCVLTESALPTYLRNEPAVIEFLITEASRYHLDIIVGSMDRNRRGKAFNAAYGITSGGIILPTVYHKRYLVPFGEYTPVLVRYLPEWVKRLTNTPAGGGFEAGKEPRVLTLSSGRIAPLICFECISPELAASSVRNGGELLVNISDLAWFHKSSCGQQMIASSVFRAIENRRYFIFAANTGPSAIIDPRGRITELSKQGKEQVVIGRVGFVRQMTPFSRWAF
jgi:apolipoprotein N-acyltransferase